MSIENFDYSSKESSFLEINDNSDLSFKMEELSKDSNPSFYLEFSEDKSRDKSLYEEEDINEAKSRIKKNTNKENPSYLSIIFDERIIKKIVNDKRFGTFVRQIELAMMDLPRELRKILSIKLNLKKDWEIPECNNYILKLDFVGLDFNTEMEYWKLINNKIFKEIENLKNEIDRFSDYFHNLKKKLYVELNL